MSVFSKVMGNPYMKYGATPAFLGADAGMVAAAYSNYADVTDYNMGTAAALGAGAGLLAASPFGLTSRVGRDYAMYSATSKSVGAAPSSSGFTKARGLMK